LNLEQLNFEPFNLLKALNEGRAGIAVGVWRMIVTLDVKIAKNE